MSRQSNSALFTVGFEFIKVALLLTVPAALSRPLMAQCSVEGRVLNPVKGSPVRRAEVNLGTHRTLTDANGRYKFQGIAPGRYRVSAERFGFWPARQWLTLSDCQSTRQIDLMLLAGAAIAGHVYDENGEPMFVNVQLWRETWKHGDRELLEVTRQTTEDGVYRFFGLAAGRYFVSAAQTTIQEARRAYEQTFYPTPLNLRTGGEARDIDFHLRPTAAVKLGLVIEGLFDPDQFVSIDLENPALKANLQLGTNASNVEIHGLTAGSYKLTATSRYENQRYYAFANIDVGTVDIQGMRIQLAPALDVQAKLRFEGASAAGVSVSLSPTQTAHPDETGSYKWTDVIPGTYTLVPNLPESFYLKSRGTVDVRPGNQGPFEIIASAGAAELDGKVQFPDSVDKVRVILTGTRIEKTTQAASDGRFTLKGIAPGHYALVAVEEDEDQNWRNPEVLKVLTANGVDVDLASGTKAHRDLALTR
jgi:hypothetical protein